MAALGSGSIRRSDAYRVVGKEAASGLVGGTILGIMVSAVAKYGMGISDHVSMVVLLTIPLISAMAGTLASGLPFVCLGFGLDPTVIAAPAMTSAVDVAGLLSYFLIANRVFRYFGLEL